MIPWLRPGAPFPPVSRALRQPNGLLCASIDVTASRLVEAYQAGIFPWYGPGEPVLWWSPDPRMVLATDGFIARRSLRKKLRSLATDETWQIRIDTSFDAVMRACAEPRPGQDGTWITEPIMDAYGTLHRRGLAHSIEVWAADALIGGLYGVAIGRMFYGESMFSRVADASKVALATLVRLLLAEKVPVIDCQQNTSHLASLGGREIPRADFLAHVAKAAREEPVNWKQYTATPLNQLLSAY